MNKNLKCLHGWVSSRYGNYLSMIAVGSIAVGDDWIKGRSDRDILLVFEGDSDDFVSDFKDYLKSLDFDDSYLFTPLPKSQFIGPLNHSHDFSHKFRSQTLYGQDLIQEVELPPPEATQQIYEQGLERVVRRFNHRIANTSFWSEEKTRDVFWKLFKHSFMYLAIKAYSDSGNYPKRRIDVVGHYGASELKNALVTLNSINDESKESIVNVAEELVDYLRKL